MIHVVADLPGNWAQAHEKEPLARGEQTLDSTTAPDPQTTANHFGARMAAVSDQSMALVSSFMNVGTPTAFLCSPRMGISPRCGASPRSAVSSGWGVSTGTGSDEVVGQVYKVAPPSTAVVQLSAPPILSREVKQRSVSTLSLGDENENPINNTMLARYTSEDLMGVFSLPVLTGLHNETPRTADSSWALNGSNAEEGSSFISNPWASGTPRGGDFARLDRNDSGMTRIQSLDLANIIKAANGGFTPRAADSPAVTPRVQAAAAAPAHAASAPASASAVHVPSTSEANTFSAPSAPAPSASQNINEKQQHSHVASSSSSAHRSSASTSEEEQEEDLAASGRRFSARNLGKPKRKIVDDYESSDEEYTPSKKSRKGGKKSSPSSSRSSSKSSSGHSHNQRGAHVRGRPEMQETARNGQRHWATEVQELRKRWEDVDCASANSAFPAQLEIMAKRHIKNQHECLLRSLHIAVAEGMVVPHAFNNAEGKSFLGWTGFDIVPERAGDFRGAIESMFPQPLLENTLHNTFRRAGLVPSSWSEAWLGLASFHYKKPV
jgi:hypothetical protein